MSRKHELPTPTDDFDKKLLADVKKYGWPACLMAHMPDGCRSRSGASTRTASGRNNKRLFYLRSEVKLGSTVTATSFHFVG
jgi:hypothetical protein